MLRTKIKRNAGVSGTADVRVLKNRLHVHFIETDDTFEVSPEGWEREGGRYNITLEKTNDKVKYVSPPGRQEPYLVRFTEFGNRTNGVPEPKKEEGGPRQGKGGGTYWKPDSWVGVAKLEVIEKGQYEGLFIPYRVPYVFVSDPTTGFSMLEGTRRENEKVEEFLRLNGFDLINEDIPFQTNVLPWLEARLQASGKVFTATLNEKGFVDSLAPLPSFVDVSALIGGKNGSKNEAKKNGSKNGAKKNGKK